MQFNRNLKSEEETPDPSEVLPELLSKFEGCIVAVTARAHARSTLCLSPEMTPAAMDSPSLFLPSKDGCNSERTIAMTNENVARANDPDEVLTLTSQRVVEHNEYLVTGSIVRIEDEQTYGNGYVVRRVVLSTNDYDPQYVQVQFVREGIRMLDSLQVGDKVKIRFRLEGRPWQDRYFTNLVGEHVDVLEAAPKISEKIEPSSGEMSQDDPPQDDFPSGDSGRLLGLDDVPGKFESRWRVR